MMSPLDLGVTPSTFILSSIASMVPSCGNATSSRTGLNACWPTVSGVRSSCVGRTAWVVGRKVGIDTCVTGLSPGASPAACRLAAAPIGVPGIGENDVPIRPGNPPVRSVKLLTAMWHPREFV